MRRYRRRDENVEADRMRFRMEFPRCMNCGDKSSDIHEITRGSFRNKGYANRCTWLSLCRTCHDHVGSYATWPITRQLALKYCKDREYYDLATVNVIRGRSPTAITQDEVEAWLSIAARTVTMKQTTRTTR